MTSSAEALARLSSNYYNSAAVNAASNPGGMGVDGHVQNFPASINDIALVAGDCARRLDAIAAIPDDYWGNDLCGMFGAKEGWSFQRNLYRRTFETFGSVYADPRYAFARASAKTVVNSANTIALLGPGTIGLTDLGVLLEAAATNVLTRTHDFGNAAWTKGNCTINTAAFVSTRCFNGSFDKLAETNANGTHLVEQAVAPTTATKYTSQVKAKAAERSFLVIQQNFGGIGGNYAIFNLATGALGAGGTAAGKIQSLGNGEYLCSLTGTTVSNAAGTTRFYTSNADSVAAYVGTTGSGIYVADAQTEVGEAPTSYVETVAATAARVADALTETFAWPAAPFTLFAKLLVPMNLSAGGYRGILGGKLVAAQVANYLTLDSAAVVFANGIETASCSIAGLTPGTVLRIGASIALDGTVSLCVNGGAIDTAIGGIGSTIDTLVLGALIAGGGNLNGWLQGVFVVPRQLTDAELIAFTST